MEERALELEPPHFSLTPFQTGPEVILKGFDNKSNRATNHVTGNRHKQSPRLLPGGC